MRIEAALMLLMLATPFLDPRPIVAIFSERLAREDRIRLKLRPLRELPGWKISPYG